MKTYDEADEIMILFEEIRLELLQEGKFCYFSFQAIQRKLVYKQEHKVSWQIRSVSWVTLEQIRLIILLLLAKIQLCDKELKSSQIFISDMAKKKT